MYKRQLLFLAAHVFFAVIAPFSWKTFPSMLIGWMPRGEAEKEHAGWMERLEREQPERGMDESALGAGERAAAQETMGAAARAAAADGTQGR